MTTEAFLYALNKNKYAFKYFIQQKGFMNYLSNVLI